jgi:hypothetical protein
MEGKRRLQVTTQYFQGFIFSKFQPYDEKNIMPFFGYQNIL